ncbi:MAG: hypothetical protein KH452_09215 [Clostridiales bacterium]|nr:hypothetical protein [Clostridiales bacterium]
MKGIKIQYSSNWKRWQVSKMFAKHLFLWYDKKIQGSAREREKENQYE